LNTIKINQNDNVAVALDDIKAGTVVNENYNAVVAAEDITRGHKIAVRDIPEGTDVIKYGYRIGRSTKNIKAGERVHVHNMQTTLSGNTYFEYDPVHFELPHVDKMKFMGYRRADQKVGVRNELWIIPTVGCVNSLAQKLAAHNQDLVKGSVEGIYAFTHPYGCSQMGDDHETTKKILASLVQHPNAAGVLVVSLGCENLTLEQFQKEIGEWDDKRVKFLICQEASDELLQGSRMLSQLAEYASGFEREPIDGSELIVGLKCGASDGLSGITANPTVGAFSDRLISMGGSTILTEVPEMFGAEEILLGRCKDRSVFDRAVGMINGFRKYFTDHGQVVYENPSPGNKAGGITTLEDKSCGCVQKGGRADVTSVLEYGEKVQKKGLSLLSGPGNDIVSTTALTAAGAHIILFTTGRGTPLGAPVPTVKISSNTKLYDCKGNWIDFNAGVVADGKSSIEETSEQLLKFVLDVASGKRTHQEQNGYRDIAILKDGVTL